MENILKELGFTHFTGPLWRHTETSIIVSISEISKPSDIVGILLRLGEAECQAEIRTALGIK